MSKLAVAVPPGPRLEACCFLPSTSRKIRIKMRSWSVLAAASLFFVIGVTSSPVQVTEPATELLPPKVDSGPTLATELMPPPLPEKSANYKKDRVEMLFLINIFAVKNETAEESNDVLQEDVLKEVPEESNLEPLGIFLLLVEEDDESKPVNLDEVATVLTDEGFDIEKVSKDGETSLIKVNLDSVENIVKNAKVKANQDTEEVKSNSKQKRAAEWEPLEASGQLVKIRWKRHLCLKCMLGGGGGGGGYYPQPQPAYQPVVVVPVYGGGGHHGGGGGFHHGGGGGGYYPQPQPYPQPCQTCGGGNGYGPGGGGGNAYAQASAQASASASSNSYGGYY